MASSSVAAGVRPRARMVKVKPNIMGGAKRSVPTPSSAVVATPKPVVTNTIAEPQKEIKSPPPVRRVLQLETPKKPDQPLDAPSTISQPAVIVSPHKDSECTGNSDLLPTSSISEEACIEEVSPKKIQPNSEKAIRQTTTTIPKISINKVRNTSGRTRNESKEKDEALRNRHKKGQAPPEKEKMTMFDLIYWNPETNPMTYEEEENETPVANKEANATVLPSENEEKLAEEAVDDPECAKEGEGESGAKENEGENEESMPVPQVKIGPDGNIILDEQSLVIETAASKLDISSTPVVYGHKYSNNTTYASFRNKKQIKTWSDRETAKFYVALSTVGTDFSMMANLFPKRERKELKLKFKREEKFNRELVDKAIRGRLQYDLSIFDESDEELENEDELAKNATKGRKRQGRKKKPASDDCDKEKGKRKKRRGKKCVMQEEDDSDYDVEEIEYEEEEEPSDVSAKQPDNQSNLCDKDTSETSTKESSINCEENVTEKETSDDVELLEGVLKQTRSGRQPKKRELFTIKEKEPKKRAKKLKLDDNISVSTLVKDANNSTVLDIAPQDICKDSSGNIIKDSPHSLSSQNGCQEKITNDLCTIMQPENASCPDLFNSVLIDETREIQLVESVCSNHPIDTNTVVTHDEADEQDEEIRQEQKILESVLKKTRSGRQPKMKPVFTINNLKRRKETKEKATVNQAKSLATVTQPSTPQTNPMQTMLSTSSNEVYLLSEKPAEDGSQVAHLYMMSPPLQPKPVNVAESPTTSDHDYVLQNLVNIPVNIGETTESDPTSSVIT